MMMTWTKVSFDAKCYHFLSAAGVLKVNQAHTMKTFSVFAIPPPPKVVIVTAVSDFPTNDKECKFGSIRLPFPAKGNLFEIKHCI